MNLLPRSGTLIFLCAGMLLTLVRHEGAIRQNNFAVHVPQWRSSVACYVLKYTFHSWCTRPAREYLHTLMLRKQRLVCTRILPGNHTCIWVAVTLNGQMGEVDACKPHLPRAFCEGLQLQSIAFSIPGRDNGKNFSSDDGKNVSLCLLVASSAHARKRLEEPKRIHRMARDFACGLSSQHASTAYRGLPMLPLCSCSRNGST